jgi:hypothetical protein
MLFMAGLEGFVYSIFNGVEHEAQTQLSCLGDVEVRTEEWPDAGKSLAAHASRAANSQPNDDANESSPELGSLSSTRDWQPLRNHLRTLYVLPSITFSVELRPKDESFSIASLRT